MLRWLHEQTTNKTQLIENRVSEDGMVETGVKGVQLFRVTDSIPCAPAVYESTVVAIVNGAKEAIFDGKTYVYDSSRYMCCTMSMPVEVGAPSASPDSPLLGVFISLDLRVMTELAIEMESASGAIESPKGGHSRRGLRSPIGTNRLPMRYCGCCNWG